VCLYNMDDDPNQARSVAVQHPEVTATLLARWKGFQDSAQQSGQQLDLSPAFIEELQKSGYDFRPATP